MLAGFLLAAIFVGVGPLASGDARERARSAPPAVAGVNVGIAEPATPQTLAEADEVVQHLIDAPETHVVAQGAKATVPVHQAPGSDVVTHRLDHPTETRSPLVFLVEDSHDDWLKVQLPVRPNGSTGWVRRADVDLTTHRYRIIIDLGDRTFRLLKARSIVMHSPIAVGAEDTPTPGGLFYVKELLKPPRPDTLYGPYAFGLSGFSNALSEFAGGAGVIGIHGTDDPDAIGNEVSHGCIRLPNDEITRLASILPLGTPVTIEA